MSMTKRERLEAAIAGERVDRLPVALWRHWPGDDQDAAASAAAHLKWQADYDWDLIKFSPPSNYSVSDWGVRDRWVGHIEGTRENTHLPIQRPEDWTTLRPLDPRRGVLGAQLEALRLLGEGVRGEVPTILTVFSPLSVAKHLAGNETVISHLRSHPDAFRQGLAVISEAILSYIEAARETGISGIYYAIQHACYAYLSRDEYLAFGRPDDERILKASADLWATMAHLHGTSVMFDLVSDLPMPILNWHDRDCGVSLGDGLGRISGAASGGVSQWTIHQEGPEQTLREAEDAAAQTGGRRLLLGTGCVIMTTTPQRNIRALREAAETLPVS